MLVKLSGETFVLAIDADEAAMLVEDIADHALKRQQSETTWAIAKRMNELWWYQTGASLGDIVESIERLEDEEWPPQSENK